ncbi:MAG: AmmeMemoRadiSam system protein A [Terriglobales bacterium]
MSKLSETPESATGIQMARAIPATTEFSPEQRRSLLAIAHEAILSRVERRPFADVPPPLPGLAELRGVFTTLYLKCDLKCGLKCDLKCDPKCVPKCDPRGDASGDLRQDVHSDLSRELRGCVGYAVPIAPLYRAVAETARAAGFEDSRFLPVTREEALNLEVSLSVLSPVLPIRPEAIQVGHHGLIVSQGVRRGLLLPQVALEHGWDRETFLEQTCRKAGLPPDAWRMAATIEAFSAEVFSDFDTTVATG